MVRNGNGTKCLWYEMVMVRKCFSLWYEMTVILSVNRREAFISFYLNFAYVDIWCGILRLNAVPVHQGISFHHTFRG